MEINFEDISFQIIANAGEAKSFAMLAIQAGKKSDFETAKEHIKKANELLLVAEKAHFGVIQKEAQGEQLPFKVLFMHAEDQLFSTQITIDLANEFIDIYKILNKDC